MNLYDRIVAASPEALLKQSARKSAKLGKDKTYTRWQPRRVSSVGRAQDHETAAPPGGFGHSTQQPSDAVARSSGDHWTNTNTRVDSLSESLQRRPLRGASRRH